ncbi:MAG TPA: Clp protease N-terminal domain-containing protein [Symbiobacteriaceae bacterium]
MPGYTPAALAVLDRARAEAKRLGYPFIQREQLFLGLLADPDVDRILEALGTDAKSIREAVESRLPPAMGTDHGIAITLLPTAEQVFRQRAQTAAALLNHSAVSTLHILMGFLLEQHGVVADVLRSHGITLDRLMEVIRNSDGQGG